MARLNVSATTHPRDVGFVLVSVEDGDGEPIAGLQATSFQVNCWANGGFSAGAGFGTNWFSMPVASVVELPSAGVDQGAFYELELGNLHLGNADEPPEGFDPSYIDPIVYTVIVHAPQGDRGQAISCRCRWGDVKDNV